MTTDRNQLFYFAVIGFILFHTFPGLCMAECNSTTYQEPTGQITSMSYDSLLLCCFLTHRIRSVMGYSEHDTCVWVIHPNSTAIPVLITVTSLRFDTEEFYDTVCVIRFS